jgi:hypothetical protein
MGSKPSNIFLLGEKRQWGRQRPTGERATERATGDTRKSNGKKEQRGHPATDQVQQINNASFAASQA